MDFLSANSGFAVQNDGTYLPRITRETCICTTATLATSPSSRAGADFTNILLATFMRTYLKSTKNKVRPEVLFALLGYGLVKAASKMLVKSTTDVIYLILN